MEAIALHARRLQCGRDRQAPRHVRQAEMERRVEAGDVRTAVEVSLGQPHHLQRGRPVQRCEDPGGLQRPQHLRIDQAVMAYGRPAVNDAVADRGGRRRALFDEQVEDAPRRLGMVGDRALD